MNNKRTARELVSMARGLVAVKMPPGMGHIRTDDWPFAVLIFKSGYVEFRVQMDEDGDDVRTGKQPYGNNAPKAINTVLRLLKRSGVDEKNIQVL